jgi:hypothetical protein
VNPATLVLSSLVALSLVPAAAADFSILNGTAVIHTNGDPGLSALGNPVARIDPSRPCYSYDSCIVAYSNPAGAGEYQIWAHHGLGSCGEQDHCVVATLLLPSGVGLTAALLVDEDPAAAAACFLVDCVFATVDPLCVHDWQVGEIVCET